MVKLKSTITISQSNNVTGQLYCSALQLFCEYIIPLSQIPRLKDVNCACRLFLQFSHSPFLLFYRIQTGIEVDSTKIK